VPDIFGVDLAGEIADAMGDGLLPGRLKHYTYGSRTTGSLSDGQAASFRRYNFRGIQTDYKTTEIDGTRVIRGDKRVLIIGGTLPSGIVPGPDDEVEIEGRTLRIVALERRDPAAATYVVQARG
jgi:hypothetical protein